MNRLFFALSLFYGFITLIMGGKAILFDYNYYSFLILGIQSIFYLYRSKYFNNISLFYWFQVFFIVLPGVVQYSMGISHFTNETFYPIDFFKTNIVFIVVNFFVFISYRYKKINQIKLEISPRVSPYLSSVIAATIVLYYFDFNLEALFTREYESEGISFKLIIEKFVRVVPLISFIYVADKEKNSKFGVLMLLIIMLVFNNPIGVPRYFSAMVLLSVLLVFRQKMTLSRRIYTLMSLGLVLIFPLLNFFRYEDSSKISGKLALGSTLFSSVNMDTYQSMIVTLKFNIVTYGNQLLGVLFFFVPRSIWPTKPEGSGRLIAEEANYVWDNVSANFFAEGYINFGYIGVIIFSIVLGRWLKVLDRLFVQKVTFGLSVPLVALMPFIYRGDFMSSFSYLIAYILACICLFRVKRLS